MRSSGSHDTPPAHGAPLLFTVVLALAFVGYLVGVGDPPREQSPLVREEAAGEEAPGRPMPSYLDLRLSPRGEDARLAEDLERLRGPARTEPVVRAGELRLAVAERSRNRAYDGAPPTVPHPVRQDSASECRVCHEEGLRLRGALASALPHAAFTSCTQCHVVQDSPIPGASLPPETVGNSFVGLLDAEPGARAWTGAPPVIPHSTPMRETCLGCHGPNGRDALRSSHPERESCTQCHAARASLAQGPWSPP